MTAKTFNQIIRKFNPYHDSLGRFSSSNGAASFTYNPGASTAHSKAIERAKEEAETGTGFKGTLYHGSPNKDIKEFDMSRAGQNTSSGEKLLFFTDSKKMADDFSYERLEGSSKFFQQRGEKGRVYEVDVEMKHPLDFRNLSDKDIENVLKLDEEGLLTKDAVKQYAQSNHQLLKVGLTLTADSLKELGYDGLIANTGKAGHNSIEYAVVDSKQAKIRKSDDMALTFSELMKFNPYHDKLGRFTSGSGGGAISIKNVVTGGFQGQTDAKLTAEIDGNVAGTLSYSEYEGEPHINMIETNPEYRGNGVATKMLQNLQSLYPGKNINTGMLTEDGSKLFEKVSEKVPNKEYSEVKRKLDGWKKELSRFESLSDEENANLSQKDGDRWNELYDLIDEGNTRLRGMREYDTFIKTNKSFNESDNNASFQIAKADEDKRLVFGWALVSATSDGKQIIDHQGDIVDQDELEDGAYEYVLNFRDAGEEHIGSLRKKARMVESVVFTEEKLQAMGIPLGTVPYGWWIGFYVDDDDTWEKIKNGTYKMFSIEGRAIREPVTKALRNFDEFPEYNMWLEENLDATEDDCKAAKEYYKNKKKADSRTVAKTFSELIEKFNPYHDRLGRFATGNGYSFFTIRTKDPGKQHMADMAIAREKLKNAQTAPSKPQSKPQAKPKTKPQNKKPEEPEDKMHPKKLGGVERGKEMSFDEANHGTTNPNFLKGAGYRVNCQTCVVANEARRRGYDVSARPKDTPEANQLSRNTRLAWIDPATGKTPDFMPGCKEVKTPKQASKYLEENIKEGARYNMGFAWGGRSRSGHIVNVFRDSEGIKIYDPQSGRKYSGSEVNDYLRRLKYQTSIRGYKFTLGFEVLRVDDKQFNTEMVDKILTKGA